jgi:hypothetical protein
MKLATRTGLDKYQVSAFSAIPDAAMLLAEGVSAGHRNPHDTPTATGKRPDPHTLASVANRGADDKRHQNVFVATIAPATRCESTAGCSASYPVFALITFDTILSAIRSSESVERVSRFEAGADFGLVACGGEPDQVGGAPRQT